MLYTFSILVIFLCVAALYESWTIPVANPADAAPGSVRRDRGHLLRGLPNDVYFQIGILTTLGLSTKNAILIIQFARERRAQGAGLVEATLGAVRNSIPAGHHDVVGLLLRRTAPGLNFRRRRRRPECHRHGGDRRHDVRHLHRSLFHSAVLCPGMQPFPKKAATTTPENTIRVL